METSYRISGGSEFLMKAFAAAVYGINFLIEVTTGWFGVGLFISPVFMIFSYTTLAVWLMFKGVSILDKEIGLKFLTGALISAIPVINLLYFSRSKNGIPKPGILANISKIIEISKEQDKKRSFEQMGRGQEQARHERPSYRPNKTSNRYEDEVEESDVAV